jgi:hypothetical protein
MKHNISSAEAVALLEIAELMHDVSRKSPVVATLIGIDRHKLNKIKALILRLNNNETETKWQRQNGAVKKCEKARLKQ